MRSGSTPPGKRTVPSGNSGSDCRVRAVAKGKRAIAPLSSHAQPRRGMVYQIFSFLLDVIGGLLGGACLLRLYMQYQRVPFGNPVGRFVFALTDWLVLPLRKVLPSVRRWDTASLVAAYLIELAQFALLWALIGREGFEGVFLLALFGLVRLVISSVTALVIVYAVL